MTTSRKLAKNQVKSITCFPNSKANAVTWRLEMRQIFPLGNKVLGYLGGLVVLKVMSFYNLRTTDKLEGLVQVSGQQQGPIVGFSPKK